MVQGAQESMQTSVNFAKNLPYIIMLLVGGTFFMAISFMFLSVILVAPQKFSFSFALGSMCYLGAVALLRDPKVFLMSFLKKEKLIFTISYVVSLIGTFYFSLVSSSYLFALFFSIAQVNFSDWKLNNNNLYRLCLYFG